MFTMFIYQVFRMTAYMRTLQNYIGGNVLFATSFITSIITLFVADSFYICVNVWAATIFMI